MKARYVLSLPAALLLLACEDTKRPTELGAPNDASKVITDGAHCTADAAHCNKDFFFLQPLVPPPTSNPNFDAGKANNALTPSLKVDICRLDPNNMNAQGLPKVTTGCVEAVKQFAAGTVQLVSNPRTQLGWWTPFNLPADGFYYVLWDTRQTNRLDAKQYYRIKVSLSGSSDLLGYADVDPMSNLTQWQNALTGEVIQMVNGTVLPIPFRVEQGAFCGGTAQCTSATVTNTSGDPTKPYQVVTVDGGGGAVAGARFPDGWLPPTGPQSVVVTITKVPSGTDPATGARTTPCHAGLALLQFDSCYNFTTTPSLSEISPGVKFATPVTVAVCYVLEGSSPADPREKFAEMYASGPGEPPHQLTDVSDAGILSAYARNCSIPVIGSNNYKGITGLASAGWRTFKSGLHKLFGVETAYAVDLGLGGLVTEFSNVGPALTASIQAYSPATVTLPRGTTYTTPRVRITGKDEHGGGGATKGINNVPVTFTLASGNGTLLVGDNSVAQTTVLSDAFIDFSSEISSSVNGVASVSWIPPSVAGTYTMTATGPATGGPVTFTVTVPPPTITVDGVLAQGEWANADVFAPISVSLPGGGTTTATLRIQNISSELFVSLQFAQDLSSHNIVLFDLRFDGDADGVWDNGEDGFVAQQKTIGAQNRFLDTFFSCNVTPCQGQTDVEWSGTNDGSMASTDGTTPTTIEVVKRFNPADPHDMAFVSGQQLRFQLLVNVAESTSSPVFTSFPAAGWQTYTIR